MLKKTKTPDRVHMPRVIYPSENDLVPLADPKACGLPFARRTLTARIKAGLFPPTTRIGGRLFVQRAALDQYKASLLAEAGGACARPVGVRLEDAPQA